MADANSSAAAMAMASSPVKAEIFSMPGFGGNGGEVGFDATKYRVKYGKFVIGETGGNDELEAIETQGLRGVDIVVLNKTTFTFMNEFYMIVTYLEKI